MENVSPLIGFPLRGMELSFFVRFSETGAPKEESQPLASCPCLAFAASCLRFPWARLELVADTETDHLLRVGTWSAVRTDRSLRDGHRSAVCIERLAAGVLPCAH